MKKILSFFAVAAYALTTLAASAYTPVANPEAIVRSGNARFTILTPEMIRIEYSSKGEFEDNATFTIVNRELPVPLFTTHEDGEWLYIDTDKLHLRYKKGEYPHHQYCSCANLQITLDVDGQPVTWFPDKEDGHNLKGTYRTLDRAYGDGFRKRLEDGLISRSGWALINDSPSAVRADGSRSLALVADENTGLDWVAPRADEEIDYYFLGYGHDYKKALYDYTLIAGKSPLPPDYVFGYWYSKYENYSADDFRSIAKQLRDNGIPADVMILDMDWHWNGEQEVSDGRGDWTGWSWNTKLIPDPDGLLDDLHKDNFHVSLNLHPAQGVLHHEDQYAAMCADLGLEANGQDIPWQLEKTDYTKAFFKNIIHPLEKQGVDFWWLDWQQYLTSPYVDGLGETFWCNHVFFEEMKKNRPDRRPLIFHRWGGLGSHRYQIGFSGDTFINFETLAFLPYFTATASNVGYGYWGHDIGGHQSDRGQTDVNDAELLLRWIQMGVFTPIFRTHATKGPWINRQIWTYDIFPQMNAAFKLRYALFPYLYTMARKSYDTGIGICRPMYYDYPDSELAYSRDNQYFFGDDILVAPIVERSKDGISKKNVWLPEGKWWSVAHNKMLDGDRTYNFEYTLDQIPYFYRAGSIIVNNPDEVMSVTERPDKLILHIVGGTDGATTLYEDSGDSNDYDTNYATTAISQKHVGKTATYTIAARRGSADGLVVERGYDLKIFNITKPSKVLIDGVKTTASYDAASHCTTLSVPKAPCNQDRVITIKY